MSDRAERIASLSPEQRRLLESKLAERAQSREDRCIPTLPRDDDGGDGHAAVFPLSPSQRDLLFCPAFVPPGAIGLRLRGQLDVPALEASLGTICARHEALRTTFDTREGLPVQIVRPPRPVPLTRVDLRELAPSAREDEAGRLLAREAQRSFDLSRGPMLRAILVRLGDEEHILLVVIHHIACDGWSLDVLCRELGALYGAERSGGQAELTEPSIQYPDYAVWQLNRLQDGVLQESKEYWSEQLAGLAQPPNVPTDRPRRRAKGIAAGAWQDLVIAEPLLEELRILSGRHDATLYMTLLAAWVTLVHRYSGNDEIVVGTAFANRNRVDVEESIGFFSNNLVLRHDLAGDPSFAELLRRVRKTTIEALSHGEVPLKLAEEPPAAVQLGFFPRSSSRHSPQLDGLEVERIDFDIDRGEYSPFLSLVVEEGDRGLTARLYYDPNRFRAARVARTLEHLHALLERVVTDPAQLISTLPPATRPRGQTDWRALVRRARRRLQRVGRRTRRRLRRIVRRSRRRSRHVVLLTLGRLRGVVLRARRAAGRVRARL